MKQASVRLFRMPLILITLSLFSGCSQESLDAFYGTGSTPHYQSRPQYQGGTTDSFYAEQNAKREANMRAVQEQQRRNELQNYKNGYTNELPKY